MKKKNENPLPKMLPGAVCKQMVRCGKPACKCSRGELHGPYFYHFTRRDGTLVKRYLRAAAVEQMRAACDERRARERQRREVSKLSVHRLTKLSNLLRESEMQLATIREGEN